MRALFTLILSLLVVASVQANGKKQAPVSITFHMEATDIQSKRLSVEVDTPKGKKWIERSPFISTKDIIAYNAFPSPHNPDFYGVSLQLNKTGSKRLNSYSGLYKGKWIVASVNGQVVDMIFIDRQVDGRVITIWRGVDPEIVKLCDSLVPRIGEDPKAWKERLKAQKKK